ncbi:MAG TPA: hypothetical protein VFA03_03005 [Acetobacteraceae bacterium]|nr:hypothetical protein [Acetobacteraceae bacterium]
MTSNIALIRKEPRSDDGVDFPDFPGCICDRPGDQRPLPLSRRCGAGEAERGRVTAAP